MSGTFVFISVTSVINGFCCIFSVLFFRNLFHMYFLKWCVLVEILYFHSLKSFYLPTDGSYDLFSVRMECWNLMIRSSQSMEKVLLELHKKCTKLSPF